MDDKSVTPDPWAAIAAELHRIADDAEKLIGEPAPRMFNLNIQPFNADGVSGDTAKGRPRTVAAVDAVGLALVGKAAHTHKLSGGSFHHSVDGQRGAISFSIYQSVADPDLTDKDEELERLRAEVERLREEVDQAHAGALDEDNQRAKAVVIAGLRTGEHGRVVNPNLARFLAHREDAKRSEARR